MYYGKILTYDTTNGLGCRTILFVSGCRHHCKGCFNDVTWSFTYGKPYTDDTKQSILDSLKPSYIDGLTLLGGEPMEPENQPVVLDLLKSVKEQYPNKNIWVYSGYTWEELTGQMASIAHTSNTSSILDLTDVLVDGEYVADLADINLYYRGSSNQRLIDVAKSNRNAGPTLLPLSP